MPRSPRSPQPMRGPDGAPYPVQVELSARLKHANAALRAGVIHVRLPSRWPADLKADATQALVQRVLAKAEHDARQAEHLRHALADLPRLTLNQPVLLDAYVRQLNAETFQVPLAGVRIGQARYSRLAQMNLRTRVMTVSIHCLVDVPAPALRYLILHELAHLLERGHNARFWGLVGQFCPDYPQQVRLIEAHHRASVRQAEGLSSGGG